MKQYKTVSEAMKQGQKKKIILFQRVKSRPFVMRPGKTKKDKTITKSWGNRFTNQQARAEKK